MQNPFETGQIKNYVLLYVAVVVIMILFFIASTLFYEPQKDETKTFGAVSAEVSHAKEIAKDAVEANKTIPFKLLEKSY
ncbi:MAG: hypothetical protein IE916_09085 [Epsilonproteobacteria bacterium]|nr:hypothetical protein [Campylobacterota bacterium]